MVKTMRILIITCVSTGLILAILGACPAQDERPIDYRTKSLAEWIEALKDPDHPQRRDQARTALGPDGPYAKVAVPLLIDAFGDKKAPPGWDAAQTLADYGPGVVASLLRALKRPEASVREGVAQALRFVRPKPIEAVPVLVQTMSDPDPYVRAAAAWSIGVLDRSAGRAIPSLISALRDDHEDVRAAAAGALSQMGRRSKPAVPALIVALRDKNERVRDWAAQALWRIGPDAKAAVPQLIEAFQNKKDVYGRWRFAQALGGIRQEAKDAVPALVEGLQDTDDFVRRSAAIALREIGPGAKAAMPALIAAANDKRNTERDYAASAALRIDTEFAARHGIKPAPSNVQLRNVPAVKLGPRATVTVETTKRIEKLIRELADVQDPDFGMSATLSGLAFAPLPDQARFQMGLVTNHRIKPSVAFRSLVEIGPVALPFLVESLGDKTPTKLKIEAEGMMVFGSNVTGNALNRAEERVLSEEVVADDDADDDRPGSYTLKVGDVCFVAIGQIVGRPYFAVCYQPTAMVVVNSPVERKGLRERVRALWLSNDPTRKLLDSLLIDYATEGVFNGKSLDAWGEGSDIQIQAAMRLLYYFPAEVAPLIANRLRSFDVRDGEDSARINREVKNGVQTAEFIKAVSWCTVPAVEEALAEIAKRTDDPAIKEALKRDEKNRTPTGITAP